MAPSGTACPKAWKGVGERKGEEVGVGMGEGVDIGVDVGEGVVEGGGSPIAVGVLVNVLNICPSVGTDVFGGGGPTQENKAATNKITTPTLNAQMSHLPKQGHSLSTEDASDEM